MSSNGILGKRGEDLACVFCQSLGFEIIARNFRYERAEIDIILKNDKTKTLVFAEVKTRRTKTFGEPEESVTEFKQMQLLKSAEGFIMNHPEYDDYEKRFDVIAVFAAGGKETINHIENAF